MKRYYGVVSGRVQGVGFRYFCQSNALRLGLTGLVRNLDNGNVEFYVQGDETRLMVFLDQIQQGDGRFIQVKDYQVKEVDLVPNEKKFSYY
ncbi:MULTISPECIES: acylphosphatase [Terrabacteria group]|uniref:acylphosphatase n=1 Tax=Bacillati TaxID=1783272 RepID=UPI0019395C0C|nr:MULTISPECIES: acylphosphatase [Terrabacteria group]MBW9212254.1 acylphosphatase [Trueperella sp. zg.1013]QRG86204.1 acylphosphatase [Bulleidia sp. zg-1006]